MINTNQKEELANSEGKKIEVHDEDGREWSGVIENIRVVDNGTALFVAVSDEDRGLVPDNYADDFLPVYVRDNAPAYVAYQPISDESAVEKLEVIE